VGRALALLGFEVRRGVASREEVERGSRKAQTAARQPERPAAPPQKPAPQEAERAPRQSAPAADLDTQILRAAEELGYDAAKVRKWVNQKFEVTGGLESLTPHDKREVLKIFQEQASRPQQKAARK
jgi:hypothetical protein